MATAMTKYKRIAYFLLAYIPFIILIDMFVSPGLRSIVMENLGGAWVALWIGWSLNDKARRLAVSQNSYLALCIVYLIVVSTLAILMPVVFSVLSPNSSNASDQIRGFYALLLVAIAYAFSWVAIKMNNQKLTENSN
jgi:hypothetical protein